MVRLSTIDAGYSVRWAGANGVDLLAVAGSRAKHVSAKRCEAHVVRMDRTTAMRRTGSPVRPVASLGTARARPGEGHE